MESFLLPDTHDRIRCFREALRSGPGLMVKRDRAKEPGKQTYCVMISFSMFAVTCYRPLIASLLPDRLLGLGAVKGQGPYAP